MAKPIVLSDDNFEAEVIKSNLPVLVDFWATWCAPCRMIAPVLEELAGEYQGRFKVAKLDVDENPLTATRFGIRSIPTLIFFNQGDAQNQLVGLQSRDQLKKKFDELLAATGAGKS